LSKYTTFRSLALTLSLIFQIAMPSSAAVPSAVKESQINGILDAFLSATEAPTPENLQAADKLKAKLDSLLASAIFDANGNIASIRFDGREVNAQFSGDRLQGLTVDGVYRQLRFLSATNENGAQVVLLNGVGQTVGIVGIREFGVLAPQVASSFPKLIQHEDRTLESVRLDANAYASQARSSSSQSQRSGELHKAIRLAESCLSDCDGQRDMEASVCDAIFDVQVGAIVGVAILVGDLTDPRARSIGAAAVALAGAAAALGKQNCKANAIIGWAICRSAC